MVKFGKGDVANMGSADRLRMLWQHPEARRATICVAASIAAMAIGKATPHHRFLAAQFFTGDGHPTAKANRLRAELLRDTIAKIEARNTGRH